MLEILALFLLALFMYIFCMSQLNNLRAIRTSYKLDSLQNKLRWHIAKSSDIPCDDKEFMYLDAVITKTSSLLSFLNIWYIVYFFVRHHARMSEKKVDRIESRLNARPELMPFYDEYTKLVASYLIKRNIVSVILFMPFLKRLFRSKVAARKTAEQPEISEAVKYLSILPETTPFKGFEFFNPQVWRAAM